MLRFFSFRYVKRALPVDDEHPRERFETTRDLMIVLGCDDSRWQDQYFLAELRNYFADYGRVYGCNYCQEKNFKYILVEFADKGKIPRFATTKSNVSSSIKIKSIELFSISLIFTMKLNFKL